MNSIKYRFSHYLKLCVGTCIGVMMPGRRSRLLQGEIHPNDTNIGRIDRYMLYAVFSTNNNATLREFHQAFWSTPRALKWFDAFSNRFSTHYLEHNALFVETIVTLLQDDNLAIKHVCELGTGTGDAIHYFSQQSARESVDFLGIDINAEQIERNQKLYVASPVNFEAMTIQEWNQQRLKESTLVFAFGGVMEYLPRVDVESIYAHLAENPPAVVALLETLKTNVGSSNDDSVIFGGELTLSHPHHLLLQNAGFSIVHERRVHQLGGDMLEIIAVKHRS